MYYLLAIFTGLLVAVTVVVNGGLTVSYGAWLATVIIHVVGLVAVLLVYAFKRGPIRPKGRVPLFFYMGGVIGVATTLFNNLAFGLISVSAITGLGLLGQSLVALIIDHFGLLGMEKRPFLAKKLLGLAFLAGGILLIMTFGTGDVAPAGQNAGAVVFAVVVSLLTGLSIVLARTANARLSEKTSVLASSIWNYITGLASAVVVLVVMCLLSGPPALPAAAPAPWVFTGGLVGLVIVSLLSVCVKRISSFYMTLFMFIGQVFTGVALDIALSGRFSPGNLMGGLCVAAGGAYNLWVDRQGQRKAGQ